MVHYMPIWDTVGGRKVNRKEEINMSLELKQSVKELEVKLETLKEYL